MAKNNKILKVIVLSAAKSIYSGEVFAVSSINKEGKFDILPGHARFISIIQDYLALHTSLHDKLEFNITQGVLKCDQNEIKIYLDI